MTQETKSVLCEVRDERGRQDVKWGVLRNLPNGTSEIWHVNRDMARFNCDHAARHGELTWLYILNEEMLEAFAEEDPAKLRAELIQVAAVAVAWVEAIDRREW